MADRKTYEKAGRYFKATDPESVKRLRADGEKTDLVSLGRLLEEVDPESFDTATGESR